MRPLTRERLREILYGDVDAFESEVKRMALELLEIRDGYPPEPPVHVLNAGES